MSSPTFADYRLVHRLRVRWAEIDAQRIVFNPHYLMYVDTAFTEYWRALAIPYEVIPELLGGDLYVKKSTLEYHGSAHLDDLLDVGIRCQRIGNSSLLFSAGVFHGNRLLVGAELVYVFADPATQTSRPVPPRLRELITAYEAGDPVLDTTVGRWSDVSSAASALRRTVLMDELGIPASLDQDTLDVTSVHALVRNRFGLALATARLALGSQGVATLGRVAVLRTMRGTGLGRLVVDSLLGHARTAGMQTVRVQAQLGAQPFFSKLGFTSAGASYLEAGLAHVCMERVFG